MEAAFPVGEVARRAGVSTSTLRAWERRFGLLAPQRTGGGHRRYSADDVERVRAVVALLDQGWAVDAAATAVMAGTAPPRSTSGRALADTSEEPVAGPSGTTVASPGTAGPAATADAPVPGTAATSLADAAPVAVRERPLSPEPTTHALGQVRESEAIVDPAALAAAHRALRRVVHASQPVEVTAALWTFVQDVGGRVVPAEDAGGDALPLDLAFGAAPLLPVAPPASVAHLHLATLLPGLVDDARRVLDLLRAAGSVEGG